MTMRLFALLAILFCCSTSYAEEAVEIPLSEIWGHKSFGTRDIKDLEPSIDTSSLSKDEVFQRSLVQQIRRSLNSYRRHKNKGNAGTAFVVTGTGSEALKNAHAVLVEGRKRSESFSKDSELTLVFYCYEYGRYVRLDNVSQSGSNVKIRYHFIAHNTGNMSTHFVLIPLGKMPAGTLQIDIEQLPGEGPDWGPKAAEISGELLRSLVCRPTTFTIR